MTSESCPIRNKVQFPQHNHNHLLASYAIPAEPSGPADQPDESALLNGPQLLATPFPKAMDALFRSMKN